MVNRIFPQILRQMAQEPGTNPFPAEGMPDSMTQAIESGKINPPVPVGSRFRGRLLYDRSKCIGCKLCIKVCPANATEFVPEEKKIIIHNDRCCFCAQCTEICPVKCLAMSDESLNSCYERKSDIITDTGPINRS